MARSTSAIAKVGTVVCAVLAFGLADGWLSGTASPVVLLPALAAGYLACRLFRLSLLPVRRRPAAKPSTAKLQVLQNACATQSPRRPAA